MMRKAGWMTSALALALMTASSASNANGFDETKIKVEDLPKAVKQAAKKAFPEAKMVGASKETDEDDKDEILYIVELKVDGKAVELAIDDDGEIEAIEKEIDVDDLPKAVTRAAAKRFPNGKIAKVEEVSENDDTVVYELDITEKGKTIEVVMAANGKILDIDEEDEDAKKDEDNDKKGKDQKDKKGDKDKNKKDGDGDKDKKNKDKKDGDGGKKDKDKKNKDKKDGDGDNEGQ